MRAFKLKKLARKDDRQHRNEMHGEYDELLRENARLKEACEKAQSDG